MEKKYRMLRLVATIYKFFAWVILVLGVLGACGALIGSILGAGAAPRGGPTDFAALGVVGGIIGGVLILFYAAVVFLGLYAFSELVHLVIALEENTRLTAERLQEMIKK